jgi:hypothetical protein
MALKREQQEPELAAFSKNSDLRFLCTIVSCNPAGYANAEAMKRGVGTVNERVQILGDVHTGPKKQLL